MIQKSYKLFLVAGCAALALTAACTPTIDQRGNMVEDFQIAEVKAGESTRSDVLRALGSPTTQSTFDPNIWYYIGQETEKKGILDPKITKERIVMVVFNEEGVVQEAKDIDRSRMNIPYVREKTPTHGNEVTIMQQFLGNLGKFNPNTEKK
jgi:outer membrane protein assembly factor BamE (lipoprotein component of BamABCDE complex)